MGLRPSSPDKLSGQRRGASPLPPIRWLRPRLAKNALASLRRHSNRANGASGARSCLRSPAAAAGRVERPAPLSKPADAVGWPRPVSGRRAAGKTGGRIPGVRRACEACRRGPLNGHRQKAPPFPRPGLSIRLTPSDWRWTGWRRRRGPRAKMWHTQRMDSLCKKPAMFAALPGLMQGRAGPGQAGLPRGQEGPPRQTGLAGGTRPHRGRACGADRPAPEAATACGRLGR